VAAICVFCASSEQIDRKYIALASEVGDALARRGHTLVSGGGSVSSMGAVARAARAGGAQTVGVIPRVLVDLEVADHDADLLVVTEDMRERKGEMDRRSDAFLALPGGIGTLEELLEIWVARTLGLHDKPLVVVDPFDVYRDLRAQLDRLLRDGFLREAALDCLSWTRTAKEALDRIEAELAAAPMRRQPEPQEILEAEP
jgi:uncharacterized protein (TIGR00730 family)